MTTDLGCCKRRFVGALALGLLAFSVSAQGGEIRWQPVAADGNVVCLPGSGDCGDTQVILSAGGVTVTLFLEVSGWDTAGGGHPGDPDYFLGAFQGVVDHHGYQGPMGCDLDPVGQPQMGFEGAFQALRVCTNAPYGCGEQDLLSVCTSAADCEVGQLCMDRCDFVFYQLDSTCYVATAAICYSWGCGSGDCKEDPRDGTRFYGGTLLLEVPSCAKGTYTITLPDDLNFTVFNSCPGPLIPGLEVRAAEITVQAGKCCFGIGTPQEGCADDLTQEECDTKPAPRLPIDPNSTCQDGCAPTPPKDLLAWRGPCYNCYNYAANRKTVFFAQPKIPPLPPPGPAYTCANVGAASGLAAAPWAGPAAGPRPAGWPAGECAAGQYLVALVVVPAAAGGWDYHWYRLNDNGFWTHKMGSTPATDRDAAGAVMGPGAANPPDMAALGAYAFCSYYCMPAPPAAMPGGFLDGGAWDPLTLIVGWILDTSGAIIEELLRDLSDFFSDLLSHLPSGQTVPDPEWSNSEPFRGYALLASEAAQSQGFPPFTRVFNGVVAYYSDIEGDENTVITYFADDRGLETYVRGVLEPICGNNIREVDEQCDGTDDAACPGDCLSDCTCGPAGIPTVSEWGLMVMTLLALTAGTIVFGRRCRSVAV